MPATLLLLTEAFADPGDAERAIKIWKTHRDAHPDDGSTLYRGLGDDALLELSPVVGMSQLGELRDRCDDLSEVLRSSLRCDVRRQLLEFVEAPKPGQTAVLRTPYVQVRHVEVKPRDYRDYRDWRERTIFDVVRSASEIDVFLAYHSLISTEPGVMFLSGFSCDPDEYGVIFDSPRYQEIVREAGTAYISGGAAGLYTKTYSHVDD